MRKILLGFSMLALCFCLAGCGNKQIIDMNRTFNKAIIKMPDNTTKIIDIRTWKDYEGEQLQIISTDGIVYLVSSYNCVLIDD